MTTLKDLGDILFAAIAVPVNAYFFFYAFRPWRRTPQGRALFIKAFGNALIVDLVVAYQWFGEFPYRPELRVVGLGVFFVGITYLCLSLLLSPGADRYPPWSWVRRVRGERPKHLAER